MKRLLTTLFLFALLLGGSRLFAQTGAAPNPDDDWGSPIGFVFLLIFLGIAVGAAVVGSMIASVILVGLFLLASAGVLSAGVLMGVYRKSVTAGFRTVVLLVSALGGIIIGSAGFYLINRFFHLHYQPKMVVMAGAGSGLLGGLLIGLAVFAM